MRWGKTESEVRELVRSGKLRGTYLAGKLLRISREEVLEFELRNEVSIDKR
jgi:excisionase family DNA binding protein